LWSGGEELRGVRSGAAAAAGTNQQVIVVSDTTPLNYLVLIDAIDVLPKLFQEVIVPPSVMAELTRLKTPEVVAPSLRSKERTSACHRNTWLRL